MKKVKVGVLTSSRADYGIYAPLLRALQQDNFFNLELIVFGMHLLPKHGLTIKQIQADSFAQIHTIEGMPVDDDLESICSGYGSLVQCFGKFWADNKFDLVFALGDRFEMSAAVQASIPFEVPIAHIHGGETTLGATDNIYRHQISLAAQLHFVAAEPFKERVFDLVKDQSKIFNVGSMSLDGIREQTWPDWAHVMSAFNIPSKAFVLVTIHPETVRASENARYIEEMKAALGRLSQKIHIVITLPNADLGGSHYRIANKELFDKFPQNITLVENFGRANYFSAMKNARILLGNTSSGIIEAASFGKYVINVGDRQKGRLRSPNVIDVPFEEQIMVEEALKLFEKPEYSGGNVYEKAHPAKSILHILKHLSQSNLNA